MQTFPNSTERSSDFNSTSNLVLTKTLRRHCLMLSKNWQTSSFLWISKHVQRTSPNYRWCLTQDPPPPRVRVVRWWHDTASGTRVREELTNPSPALAPPWPMGGERDIANTGMTGNRSWPVPLSGPPGLFISGSIYQIFFPAVSIYFGQQVTGYFHQQTSHRE